MSKKDKTARAEAHGRYEQRRTAKISSKAINPFSLTDEQVRAATAHALSVCPDQTSEKSGLAPKVVTNIATGRFNAEGDQRVAIITAATAMGWKP